MAPAVFTVTDVADHRRAPASSRPRARSSSSTATAQVWPPGGKQEDELLPASERRPGARPARAWTPTQHFTQPPPRYSEATLIKALEKENIGRPSTYAPIIQTIQDRLYVEQKERRFFATDLGMVVTDLLVKHFPKILDLKFTAHMEDELDDIATAKEDMVKVLDEFYYPFQDALKAAETQMERVQIPTSEVCHVCGAPMVLKFGKTGQFLGCSKYPECKATRPLGGQPRAEAVESEHACPKCGKPLLIRENKRGEKFLSCSGYPECKESFNIDEQGNPVPSGSRPSTSARSAASRWPCARARGAVPGLHGLSQVPQRPAGRRPRASRSRRSRSTSSARSAASRWPSARAAAARSSAARTIPSAAAPPRSPTSSRSSSPSMPPPRRRARGPT